MSIFQSKYTGYEEGKLIHIERGCHVICPRCHQYDILEIGSIEDRTECRCRDCTAVFSVCNECATYWPEHQWATGCEFCRENPVDKQYMVGDILTVRKTDARGRCHYMRVKEDGKLGAEVSTKDQVILPVSGTSPHSPTQGLDNGPTNKDDAGEGSQGESDPITDPTGEPATIEAWNGGDADPDGGSPTPDPQVAAGGGAETLGG